MEKKTFLVPTRFEVVRRPDFEGNEPMHMVTLVYRKEWAERITLDIPSGAVILTTGSFTTKGPSNVVGPLSGTFDLTPDNLSSASGVSGPFEGTFTVKMIQGLPDDESGRTSVIWERTLPVSYDPATARRIEGAR